jgi:acyl-[acyl carrier protein]--UDP-N-acetylglucosamine O-acyltransferase
MPKFLIQIVDQGFKMLKRDTESYLKYKMQEMTKAGINVTGLKRSNIGRCTYEDIKTGQIINIDPSGYTINGVV